jgi:hypothetical protein
MACARSVWSVSAGTSCACSSQTVAAVDPVDLRVHRGGNRIQEIQIQRVGNEYRGQAF